MSFKEMLKRNKTINKLGKRVNIYRQFKDDERDFTKCYSSSASRHGDYRYSILLLVHSLEKGMTMPSPRPFGKEKAFDLMHELEHYPLDRRNEFEYRAGISVLRSYIDFYKSHGWTDKPWYNTIRSFIAEHPIQHSLKTGCKEYTPDIPDDYDYQKLLKSRHSVRDYQNCELLAEDVKYAVDCFIETPTACNRQMCRIIYVKDDNVKKLLDDTIVGISGFNKKTVQYFVITYDLASLSYSGERNQGLFNAGLCTTNFINGLHTRGIGSCCLQWTNKKHQDTQVREALKLDKSERIGIVIGAGYYLKQNIIPCSVRRSVQEVFRII